MSAEKMNVYVSRATVQLELEMVVLQVAQAVGHFLFAARNGLRPEGPATAFYSDRTWHGSKIRINHKFRPDGTGAQLRSGEVQVVLLLEAMVRKFVPLGHAHAIRPAIGTDHISGRDLALFTAIFRVGGDDQRVVVCVHHRALPFVKPLGGNPDLAVTRPAAFYAPAKHLHAVGEFLLLGHMHRGSIARAAEVGQAGAGYQAAGYLLRVIDGREQLPLCASLINLVVVDEVICEMVAG